MDYSWAFHETYEKRPSPEEGNMKPNSDATVLRPVIQSSGTKTESFARKCFLAFFAVPTSHNYLESS